MIKKTVMIWFIGIAVGMFFLSPDIAFSQMPGYDIRFEQVIQAFQDFACWLASIAIAIATGAIIVYGILMLMSRGDPGKFGDARKGFVWAIIGTFVIYGVFVIIESVAVFIGASTVGIFSCI